jgi:CelD/BcsL family acetyltransferase involved in cellulose biosynthesis
MMAHTTLREAEAAVLPAEPSGAGPAAPARLEGRKDLVYLAMVSDVAGLERLEGDWNELFERSARPTHVFQSYAWSRHWCRHYLGREKHGGPALAIVTGHINGRLVLVMPLVVERRLGLVRMTWLGEPVSQYGDVLAAPEAAGLDVLERAWRLAVAETGADLANLRKVRADAQAAPLLRQLGAIVTGTEEAPAIDLRRCPSAQVLFDQNQHRKKNRKRYRRRLEERGPAAFETHAGSEMAADLARRAIELKCEWLKEKGQISTALIDPRFRAFFMDAARGLGRQSRCIAMALKSGDSVASLQIVLECKGWRFLHICVYDKAFEKCGAGSLLLEDSIVDSYEQRIEIFDMLAPRHPYKAEFADGAVAVEDHGLPLSLRGKLYVHGFLASRQNLKRAVESLPPSVRRSIASALARLRGGTGASERPAQKAEDA